MEVTRILNEATVNTKSATDLFGKLRAQCGKQEGSFPDSGALSDEVLCLFLLTCLKQSGLVSTYERRMRERGFADGAELCLQLMRLLKRISTADLAQLSLRRHDQGDREIRYDGTDAENLTLVLRSILEKGFPRVAPSPGSQVAVGIGDTHAEAAQVLKGKN